MDSGSNPLIEVDDLTVEVPGDLGERRIGLRRVSLRLDRAEIVALAGEGGSGKTLLARVLCGIAGPQTRVLGGRVCFAGRDLPLAGGKSRRAFRELRRGDLTVVPAETSAPFDPDQTVEAWLGELRRLARGRPEARSAARGDCFFGAGLFEPETFLPAKLGELPPLIRKRLLVMRALYLGSRFLVSEEAGTDLDCLAEASYHDLLGRVRDEFGIAVLATSGRLGGLDRFADRIGVFFEGGLLEEGEASSILHRPSHPYTREFLACEPSLADFPRDLPTISRAAAREAEETVHQAEPLLDESPTG